MMHHFLQFCLKCQKEIHRAKLLSLLGDGQGTGGGLGCGTDVSAEKSSSDCTLVLAISVQFVDCVLIFVWMTIHCFLEVLNVYLLEVFVANS